LAEKLATINDLIESRMAGWDEGFRAGYNMGYSAGVSAGINGKVAKVPSTAQLSEHYRAAAGDVSRETPGISQERTGSYAEDHLTNRWP